MPPSPSAESAPSAGRRPDPASDPQSWLSGSSRSAAAGRHLAAVGPVVAARYYAGARAPDPALEAAVSALVDALHADGLDVVAVLRAVKASVRHRGDAPTWLLDAAVRWGIARYYDGSGA